MNSLVSLCKGTMNVSLIIYKERKKFKKVKFDFHFICKQDEFSVYGKGIIFLVQNIYYYMIFFYVKGLKSVCPME